MGKVWRSAFLAAALAALSVSASAQAQTTIGQLPAAVPIRECGTGPFEVAQVALAAGSSYEVPHAGAITSWSTFATNDPSQRVGLKVVRSFESSFLVRGRDAVRSLAPGQINTFRTAIPVQAGDMISLYAANGDFAPGCAFRTGNVADTFGAANNVETSDGGLWTPNIATGFRINASATILPPPRITAISPTEGSVAGGTPVTISGVNFAEVQAVTFSTVPALSYSVNGEGQITAVAPPNVELTSRTVEVKTIAGRGDSPQTFNYVGCFVPQLKKYKLAAAKKKLKGAKCALGKVKRLGKGPVAKGLIVRQSPPAGKTLPPGTKVAVTLKTKRR